MTIYNGDSKDSPRLGRFCGKLGSTLGPPKIAVVSAANEILIHFKTDDTKTKTGFKIEYSTTISACPGPLMLTDPWGTITSQGFPKNYEDLIDCRWHIKLPPGQQVKIKFLAMDIEYSDYCR